MWYILKLCVSIYLFSIDYTRAFIHNRLSRSLHKDHVDGRFLFCGNEVFARRSFHHELEGQISTLKLSWECCKEKKWNDRNLVLVIKEKSLELQSFAQATRGSFTGLVAATVVASVAVVVRVLSAMSSWLGKVFHANGMKCLCQKLSFTLHLHVPRLALPSVILKMASCSADSALSSLLLSFPFVNVLCWNHHIPLMIL